MSDNRLTNGPGTIIPDEIARIILAPRSYTDDKVIYPAFKWLRANMPLGIARVDGYDPIWVVTKHADIRLVERDANLFHSGDHNTILTSQAGDDFTRSVNNGSLEGHFFAHLHGPSGPRRLSSGSRRNGFCPLTSRSWKRRSGRLQRSRSSI